MKINPSALLSVLALVMLQTVCLERQTLAQNKPRASNAQAKEETPIDFDRARELFRKKQSGEKLSAEDEAYLQRALEARRKIWFEAAG